VTARRQALGDLTMQHTYSNLAITFESDDHVRTTCNYRIDRFERDGDHYFHSWGTYEFGLVRRDVGWRISSIAQHLLKNEGDPSVHGALSPPSKNPPKIDRID